MSLAVVLSRGLAGLDAPLVTVEVHLGNGLPAGTVVTKLPAGCTPTPVGGKNYQYCGGNFYEPVYEGSALKYVTTTPK